MAYAATRKLIFRLGRIGFVLDLGSVIEIYEQIDADLDLACSDLRVGIVGALNFRQTRIPVLDPTMHLAIKSEVAIPDKTALVLKSSEGNWALLVDQVEGVSPELDFKPCEIPPLLKVATSNYYSRIELLDGEPMIVFEPSQYYGSNPIAV